MEDKKEKDNFWVYIAAVIIIAAGVMYMVKKDVQKTIPYGAHEELTKEEGKSYRTIKSVSGGYDK
jgi:hypothetical protein